MPKLQVAHSCFIFIDIFEAQCFVWIPLLLQLQAEKNFIDINLVWFWLIFQTLYATLHRYFFIFQSSHFSTSVVQGSRKV